MAKSTANIDLVPQEVLDELKQLDLQLGTTKNNLIELLKPVVSISNEFQKTATNCKSLSDMMRKYNEIEKQVNNEMINHKTTMSAIQKAQERLIQLDSEEAKQLAMLKEKINQKSKENRESAKAMLDEAKAAERLKNRLADIGSGKSVTVTTKNITENSISGHNESLSGKDDIKNIEQLEAAFRRINQEGFADISNMIKQNSASMVDYSYAINEASSRLAIIDSAQNEYKKSLDAGIISEDDYTQKTEQLLTIRQNLASELNSLNEKYNKNREEVSQSSSVAMQASEAFANLSDRAKELTLTILESNEAQKQIKTSLTEIDKEYKEGSIGIDEYTSKKAELITLSGTYKDVLKAASEELKNEIKASQSAEGSYNNLSARYSLVKNQLNQMTDAGKGNTEEFKKLQNEAKGLYEKMKLLQSATGKEQLNVGNYPQEVKGLTREIENNVKQLALMKVNGQEGTEEYKKLAKETSVLKDAMMDATSEIKNMASDTSDLNSVLSFTSAAGGGFTAITGAMQLFGSESSNVSEAQKKLQSVIAITTGLQALQNATQKQSALMLGISKIQAMALTKAESARSIAQKSGTVATIGATVAQKAFNTIANANPYVLLATALITVVGALVAFTSNSQKAAASQQRLNELQRIHAETLDFVASNMKKQSEANIANIEHELELAKIRNASTSELREIEDKLATEREKANSKLLGFYRDDFDQIEMNEKKLKEYTIQLGNVKETLVEAGNTKVEIDIEGKISKMKAESAIDVLQGKIDKLNKSIAIGTEIKDNRANLEREGELRAERRRQEDLKKEQEYQNKLNKIHQEEDKASFNIANEQIRYSANKNKEIAQDETQSYAQRLEAVKSFSEEMKQAIKGIADEQIEQLIKTTAQELNMDPFKQRVDLEKVLSNQINLIRFKSAQEQLKIDTDASQISVEIEKNRVDKILTERNKIADEGNLQADMKESESLKRLAEDYAGGVISYKEYEDRKTLISQNAAIQRLEIQKSFINTSLEAIGVLSDMSDEEIITMYGEETLDKVKDLKRQEAEYIMAMNDMEVQSAEQSAEKARAVTEEKMEKISQYVEAAFSLMNSLVEFSSVMTERKIQDLEKESEANDEWEEQEQERVDRMEEAGAISKEQAEARKAAIDDQAEAREEQIQKKKKEILKKQAIYERTMSIANIAWSTAQAVMAAWTNPWAAPALVPLIIAAGAVQTATVLATPIPEYAKGTPDHPGGPAIVGDGGRPEIIIANGRIFKTPAVDTLIDLPKHAIVMPDYNMAIAGMKVPTVPEKEDRVISFNELEKLLKENNKQGQSLLKYIQRNTKSERYTRELNTNIKLIR